MTLTPSSALELLRSRKFRITAARIALTDLLLEKTDRPLSADEALEQLENTGTLVNRVTVYRELQFLEAQGFLETVQFDDGVRRYMKSAGHRHHVICTSCKKMENVELPHDLDAIESLIRKKTDFTVNRHELEFYGLCKGCA